ncbi:hypothetical protein [Azotobacter vinelandii]
MPSARRRFVARSWPTENKELFRKTQNTARSAGNQEKARWTISPTSGSLSGPGGVSSGASLPVFEAEHVPKVMERAAFMTFCRRFATFVGDNVKSRLAGQFPIAARGVWP